MRKLALAFLLCAPLCFAQTQISGSAVQIGGNVPGASSLSTNGDGGQSSLVGDLLNIPANHGGNLHGYVNFMSLVGAFTDDAGNVIQPIAIGNGPVTFAVPFGATHLQLGANDTAFGDDTGSWVISVNGTHYTVLGTTVPWVHTAGINSLYPTSIIANTAPVVATIGPEGTSVLIQYVSGTVSSPIMTPLCGGIGPVSVDANGEVGCAPNYDTLSTGFFPGAWATPAAGSNSGAAITALTGDVTATGPGSSAALVVGINGHAVPGPSSGYLHWNGSAFVFDTPSGTGMNQITGDATAGPGSGSQALTLASVNSNVGSCGDSTHVSQIVLNAKGLATACTPVAISGGGGSGTVSGQASGVIPLGTSATVIGNQSHLDDGNTTAATITSTEPIAVAVAGGQGGTADLTEGTTAAATAGHDVLYADSTAHCIKQSLNGGSFACLGTGSGGVTQIVPGTHVTVSPGGGTGVVTVSASNQYDGSILAMMDDSRGTFNGGWAYVPSAAACNGTTCTVTVSTTTGPGTGSGTVGPSVGGQIEFGTAHTGILCLGWSQSKISAVTSTTISVPESSTVCTGTQSGSMDQVFDGDNTVMGLLIQKPTYSGAFLTQNFSQAGQTVCGMVTQYDTTVHILAGLGHPVYLIVQGGGNDIVTGSTPSSIETCYQQLYTKAQADSVPILQATLPPFNNSAISCTGTCPSQRDLYVAELNLWFPQQTKSELQTTGSAYCPDSSFGNTVTCYSTDIADEAAVLNDYAGPLYNSDGLHPTTAGGKIEADVLNVALATLGTNALVNAYESPNKVIIVHNYAPAFTPAQNTAWKVFADNDTTAAHGWQFGFLNSSALGYRLPFNSFGDQSDVVDGWSVTPDGTQAAFGMYQTKPLNFGWSTVGPGDVAFSHDASVAHQVNLGDGNAGDATLATLKVPNLTVTGTCTGCGGISGATSGQALIAGSATTATSSKALAGSGPGITTGPTTSVLHNCPDFSNTSGQLEDSGSPCSGGSAFITSLTVTGTSGPATVVSGVLNIPQYTGGGGSSAPVQTQEVHSGAVSGSSQSSITSPSFSTTSGDLIIAVLRTNTAGTTATFTSSPSNTWHALTPSTSGSNLILAWAVSGSTSSETVTATLSGSDTFVGIDVMNFTGGSFGTLNNSANNSALSFFSSYGTTQKTLNVLCISQTSTSSEISFGQIGYSPAHVASQNTGVFNGGTFGCIANSTGTAVITGFPVTITAASTTTTTALASFNY